MFLPVVRHKKQDELVAGISALAGRKITKDGRTLVFGRNGQLYVFVKGHRGRLKTKSKDRWLARRILRAAEETGIDKRSIVKVARILGRFFFFVIGCYECATREIDSRTVGEPK